MKKTSTKIRQNKDGLQRIKRGIFLDTKSGNYLYRFEHYGRDYEKVVGPLRQAAEIALAEAKQEVRIKKFGGQGWEGLEKLRRGKKPKLFSEAAKDYLDERANYKESTLSSYKSILNSHVLPEFGNRLLRDITDSEIKKFQVRLSKHLSASRTNGIMQLLRSILGQEFRAGGLKSDPSLAVRRLQEQRVEIDPLSEGELGLALSNIDVHYQPLFTVLAFTGARPNELTALRWNDIDWHNEIISITKGRVRGYEGLPKTKSGQRKMPMIPRVVKTLKALKQNSLKSLDGYVFTTPAGKPINKHLDRIWAKALKKAGLRHRPSYQLRHTFATQCIINGFPLPYIAKVLGHSTIDTLVRHYAGWIDEATKEQDARLKEMFKPVQSQKKAGSFSGSLK